MAEVNTAKALTVDDCTALSLHETILAHHYREMAATCGKHEPLKALEAGFQNIARQHDAGSQTYRYIGQRIVDQQMIEQMKTEVKDIEEGSVIKRTGIFTVVMFLLVMFLLTGGVMVAQQNEPLLPTPQAGLEATEAPDVIVPDETPDVPSYWEWLPLGLSIVAGISVIGLLVIVYVALVGAQRSYPPGFAESVDRLFKMIEDQAKKTTTPLDDIAVAIGKPIADGIVAGLRGRDAPLVQRGGLMSDTLNDPNGIG